MHQQWTESYFAAGEPGTRWFSCYLPAGFEEDPSRWSGFWHEKLNGLGWEGIGEPELCRQVPIDAHGESDVSAVRYYVRGPISATA
jgi:hypothetical protein